MNIPLIYVTRWINLKIVIVNLTSPNPHSPDSILHIYHPSWKDTSALAPQLRKVSPSQCQQELESNEVHFHLVHEDYWLGPRNPTPGLLFYQCWCSNSHKINMDPQTFRTLKALRVSVHSYPIQAQVHRHLQMIPLG